ncbi:MAG: energy transducer TonB [Pyrinomonadaceae bacterium]|nr:energy transducer TonB [Pyrinomonadaceae bacterium]
MILSKPQANYTDQARQNHIEGVVRLRVIFNANGSIGSITPVSGLPYGLTEQAIVAARNIKFTPKMVNDIPQTVVKTVEFRFSIYLDEKDKFVANKAQIELMPPTEFKNIKSASKFKGTVKVSVILSFDGSASADKFTPNLPKEYEEKIRETIATIKFKPATTKEGKAVSVIREMKFKFK